VRNRGTEATGWKEREGEWPELRLAAERQFEGAIGDRSSGDGINADAKKVQTRDLQTMRWKIGKGYLTRERRRR